MNSIERREDIVKLLLDSLVPIKGTDIADKYNVTRQVIVKDIAILRAKGFNIMATPDGYIVNRSDGKIKTIIAVKHNEDEMLDEMSTVIKYGGIIEDVIVEHSLYGEIKGILMVKSLNDLNKFIAKYSNQEGRLLSVLTNGVHLHTISAETSEDIDAIISELKDKKFIVSD